MNISVGINHLDNPLNLDVDMTAEELKDKVDYVLKNHQLLHLEGTDGNQIIVPHSSLSYIRIADEGPRRVGFSLV